MRETELSPRSHGGAWYGRQPAAQPRCAQNAWLPMESDTLGDDPRVTPATQGPGYGDRAAASDTVCGEAHGSGCHGSLGVAAERAEVHLAVSGLKPDWPASTATVGIAPAGGVRWIVPCSTSRGNGRSRRTLDLLQARRRTWVGRTRIGLQTAGFPWDGRRSARGESGVSPTRRRRTSRLRTQKSPANAGLLESG